MADKEERKHSHDSAEPLMLKDKLEDEHSEWLYSVQHSHPSSKPQRKPSFWFIIFLPWILLIILSLSVLQYQKPHRFHDPTQQIYSPAQAAIEKETVTFNPGHDEHEDSVFGLEPSDELDEAWLSLYPSVWQLINKEQAAQLWQPTSLFPHDPNRRYVIELDVFHQLHCLNQIRQALRPDYYAQSNIHDVHGHLEDGLLGPTHIKHCINQIRQALMCYSDVTPYVWRYNETMGYLENIISTPHTCRNYNKIRDWALPENHGGSEEVGFDFYAPKEMNDPLDPTTWIDGYSGE